MQKNTRSPRMRRLFSTISLIILGALLPVAVAAQNAPNVSGPGQNAPNVDAQAGQFINISVEHNAELNTRKGMIIHAKFNVQNALNKPSRLVAAFQYVDGRPLKGNEAAYKDTVGNVIAIKNFTPSYARASYADLQIFMPYGALNMSSGKAALRFRLSLYDINTKRYFANSGYINFNYSK